MAVLEARGLHKSYAAGDVKVDALKGVDLVVEAGEFVAVVGPSGCGKSTLLHLLGALDTPTAGEVLLDGRPLADLSDDELTLVRRQRVGFVFQFFNLVPVLNAANNVALPAVIDGRPPEPRASELLERLGLTDCRLQLPSQLSGGEQQRVAIARALMNQPTVLLADEPTGNLDEAAGRAIARLLVELNGAGQTVVLVTHNPVLARKAGRTVRMKNGTLLD